MKLNVRRQLCIPDSKEANDKDAQGEALTFLSSYLQSTTDQWNIDPLVKVSKIYFDLIGFV